MQQNEQRDTVYIVQYDAHKDFSNAGRYGRLRYVFVNVGWPYKTGELIQQARNALREWQPGDYLLMVGDPTLCGVAMTVVAEQCGTLDVLRWDKLDRHYTPQRWDFDGLDEYTATAEDKLP